MLELSRYRMKLMRKYTRGWLVPYVRSRFQVSEFKPIVAHLFTDGRCNVSCDYCYSHYEGKGMTYEIAVQAIQYLKSMGCRVFGFMGGEPLIRRDFVLKVVDYGARNGFFVDIATNGMLMTEAFIDRLGQAGIASVNLAVDCVEKRPGFPKSLARIKPIFEYLVMQRHKHGYIVFLNVNITSKNMDEVRRLTEIAHENRVGIDFHVNEAPISERERKNYKGAELLTTENHWGEFDRLVDWLIEKHHMGHIIVNSTAHLTAMKNFVRGDTKPWDCRAGRNAIVICEDGSVVPCMGLYPSEHNWGSIFDYKFDPDRLKKQIAECHRRCSSTVHYQLCEAYNNLFDNDSWRIWNWK